MTNVNAVRVALESADFTESRAAVEFPRFLAVHIPATSETRVYDLQSVTAEQLWNMLEHGASQKLGDAAAGKDGQTAKDAVTKREKTLWADGRVTTDPVTSEMHKLACAVLTASGVKSKELPSLKAFPKWLEDQAESAVAKLKDAAEAAIAERRAKTAALAEIGLSI